MSVVKAGAYEKVFTTGKSQTIHKKRTYFYTGFFRGNAF